MEHADTPVVDLSKFGTATAYCAAAGISAATLYRLLKRGEGPATVQRRMAWRGPTNDPTDH